MTKDFWDRDLCSWNPQSRSCMCKILLCQFRYRYIYSVCVFLCVFRLFKELKFSKFNHSKKTDKSRDIYYIIDYGKWLIYLFMNKLLDDMYSMTKMLHCTLLSVNCSLFLVFIYCVIPSPTLYDFFLHFLQLSMFLPILSHFPDIRCIFFFVNPL